MPLYEYSCSTCGKNFEKYVPISSEETDVRCPSGHRKVRRVYSALPIMFKGSGFYVTDHRASSAGGESKP